MDNIIDISGLTKRYGSYNAVDNLYLKIKKGEIFGLLGPNGAGKSTTILMLIGLTEPESGKVRVCNIDPIRYPIEVKQKVGYLPEDVGFYDDYSGLENILYTARLNGIQKKNAYSRALQLLKIVGLEKEKDKKAGKYSKGMRQRLGLAEVLIKDPEIIILDEPTLGIDPAGVKDFLDLIVQLSREKGITVIFSSHHLHQVQQVCDRVGIFVKGKLLAEGNIQSLAKQLFSNNSYSIEARIKSTETNMEENAGQDFRKKISMVPEITNFETNGDNLLIEASEDISAKISRLIIESGYNLFYLNKKEYGLDDIYYKYFQGTEDIRKNV